MISNLLLAADLIDVVANPYRTIEEQEDGSARLASLGHHGARIDASALDEAVVTDIELLPAHIWRWALNEGKNTFGEGPRLRLPNQELIDRLYDTDTDRISRLLLAEAVLTHPEVEGQFESFEVSRSPEPLMRLPDVWPRNYLIRLTRRPERETTKRYDEVNLSELGMLLFQIGTAASLAFVGGTIIELRESRMSDHPLIRYLEQVANAEDSDLVTRLGIHRPRDFFG